MISLSKFFLRSVSQKSEALCFLWVVSRSCPILLYKCASLPGLKFDDLMIEEDADVAEAVRRLTPNQQLARKRRQLRAFDISLKKTPLPDHVQAVQDPFEVRWRLIFCPSKISISVSQHKKKRNTWFQEICPKRVAVLKEGCHHFKD